MKYLVRAVMVADLMVGLVLLALAAQGGRPWLWPIGAVLTLMGGVFTEEWIRFRVKYPTAEAREAYRDRAIEQYQQRIEALNAGGSQTEGRAERNKIAHLAAKDRARVLRTGVDGTAVIVFLADANRGNEFEQLVYLELDVRTGGGSAPYRVRTGEYLTAASTGSAVPGRELVVKVDPADPQRVAVDWEKSLRWAPGGRDTSTR